ncbi:ornithine cyclodeaminase family protein [Herbaspirillum sp. CAH-3]|uniref:ornithine cyclodeaminase family protein n=1 Tax=Herbaspirillum sp. CAH-3 TaxID=2605746 RepID=UPI0012ACBAF0|nr:ornithine cyclodeaminase family protein [Herbaspirillum sp. CAH-3]MRT28676.1 ornithine cyclodeaminase family protein [Herbaspirillum sp. CAH-3]
MRTLLLKKEEVRKLISMKEVIGTVEEAYRAFSANSVMQPPYTGIHLPAPRGEIDFKLSYYEGNEVISMKSSSGAFPDNPKLYGVPSSMGTILLFDARSCALMCVMDGSLVTGLRTGAAGAASAKVLARKDAKVIGAIGTGQQARMQIRALREVIDIQGIKAWSRTAEKMASFQADIERDFGLPVALATSAQDVVASSDILVTTTRGTGPVVEAKWVKPGTHIIAIGADQQGKQELDPALFKHAKIVHDSTAQCCEKGESWHPLTRQIITMNDIHGELGEILLGRKPGRENDEEITIFDSTGMAIQDNTTATKIYQNAVVNKIGEFFEFIE